MAGLCGAVAGLVVVGRVGVINQDLGFGFEFTVITAVVLGGTSLFGGIGTVLGTVVGVFIPAVLANGFVITGVEPFWRDVAVGAVLIAAVYLDQLRRKTQYRD